jgi:hypothetical protein
VLAGVQVCRSKDAYRCLNVNIILWTIVLRGILRVKPSKCAIKITDLLALPYYLYDSPLQVKPFGCEAWVPGVVHGDLREEIRVTSSGHQTLRGEEERKCNGGAGMGESSGRTGREIG